MSRGKSQSNSSSSSTGAARHESAGGEALRPDRSKKAPLRQTPIDLSALDGLKGDAVGLFCWSDVRPLAGVAGLVDWRTCGVLSGALQSKMFGGDVGEDLMIPITGRFGPRRLFVFGLGTVSGWDSTVLRNGCKHAVEVMRRAGATSVVLGAPACYADTTVEAAFVKAAVDEMAQQIDQILTEKV